MNNFTRAGKKHFSEFEHEIVAASDKLAHSKYLLASNRVNLLLKFYLF